MNLYSCGVERVGWSSCISSNAYSVVFPLDDSWNFFFSSWCYFSMVKSLKWPIVAQHLTSSSYETRLAVPSLWCRGFFFFSLLGKYLSWTETFYLFKCIKIYVKQPQHLQPSLSIREGTTHWRIIWKSCCLTCKGNDFTQDVTVFWVIFKFIDSNQILTMLLSQFNPSFIILLQLYVSIYSNIKYLALFRTEVRGRRGKGTGD